jgi:hypothetical protein
MEAAHAAPFCISKNSALTISAKDSVKEIRKRDNLLRVAAFGRLSRKMFDPAKCAW